MFTARLRGFFDVNAYKREVDKLIKDVQSETYKTARKQTPVRTGYARDNWQQDTLKDGFSVTNSVPYIGRLEKGYSKQAPRGILTPTVKKVTGYIRSRRLSR